MSAASRFYLQQAETCDAAASASPLANRRAIFQQSRAVWLALAAREIENQTAREQREQAKHMETADA